ncbi:unnamed protein product [Rangifer tarandus platyrhynchus]|uniref:Uncharacterized protein n=1 Tax=Rangifer tarandus platyrhynchus TaxID=3082113 RepID=A0ABN8XWM4_RANTA|nr:unnamed protein product [Rangifer tarandus platyrhynchus]
MEEKAHEHTARWQHPHATQKALTKNQTCWFLDLGLPGPHISCQDPLSMEFSRKDHWSGAPSPTPETEPVSPVSPALVSRFFTTEPPGKPVTSNKYIEISQDLCCSVLE